MQGSLLHFGLERHGDDSRRIGIAQIIRVQNQIVICDIVDVLAEILEDVVFSRPIAPGDRSVELEPHLALRELVRKDLDTIDLPGCIGCGACSVACPNELLPHAVLNPLPLEDKEGRIVTLPVRMPARLVLARLGIDSWARAR